MFLNYFWGHFWSWAASALNTELRPPGISRTTSLHFPAEVKCSTTWRVSELIKWNPQHGFFPQNFLVNPFGVLTVRSERLEHSIPLVQDCKGRWLPSGHSLVVRAQAAQARGPGFNSWWLLALHFLLLPLKINNPLYTSYIPASKGSLQVHVSIFCLATWCYMITPCLCDGSSYLHTESSQILEVERPRIKFILFFYPVAKVCCLGNLGILNCWQCKTFQPLSWCKLFVNEWQTLSVTFWLECLCPYLAKRELFLAVVIYS